MQGAAVTTLQPALDEAASAGLLAGLEQTGQAAVLLDAGGHVIAMNGRAGCYMGPTIMLQDGRLTGRRKDSDDRLKGLVDRVLRSPAAADDCASEIIVLPQADGSPLIVRGTSIGTADPPLFQRAKALITFAGERRDLLPKTALLREAFRLTEAEASVALAVAGGATACAIAAARGTTTQTIRSHLKAIFIKTGLKRQAGLVALIMQLQLSSH